MTKLDFPDTPTTGQTFGSSGTVWRWDGTRWGSTAGAAGERGQVAFAQSVTDQGGFGPNVTYDISGLAVTYNVTAGRRYKITGKIMASTPVAGDIAQFIIADGTGQAVNGVNFPLQLANSGYSAVAEHVYTSSHTGTQTIKLRYNAGGTGTHTVKSRTDYPSYVLVEDITYEAGAGGPVTDINTLPKGLLAHAYGPDTTGGFNIISTPMQISGLMITPTLYAGRIYRVRTSITAQAGPAAAHIYVIVGDSVNTIFSQAMITRQANEYATLACDYTFKATTYQPNRAFLGLISASQASAYIGGTLKAWLTCEDLGTIGTIS